MPTTVVRKVCAATLVLAAAGTAFTLLSGTSASADPSAAVWDRLRTCESSGNYQSVDSTAAHFGAYQFDQSTWDSVGGKGRPDQNSAVEQDYRAQYLYRMRGWQPWQCADSSHLNLQNDASARTGRAPSYAESARLRTGGTPAPTPVEPPRRLSTPKPASPAPALRAVPPPPGPRRGRGRLFHRPSPRRPPVRRRSFRPCRLLHWPTSSRRPDLEPSLSPRCRSSRSPTERAHRSWPTGRPK